MIMNPTLHKISAASRQAAALLRIARVIVLGIAGLLLIVITILLSGGALRISLLDTLRVNDGYPIQMDTAKAILTCLFGILSLAAVYLLLTELYRLFDRMAHAETPFEQTGVARLKRTALLSFLLFLLHFVLDAVLLWILTRQFWLNPDLTQLLLSFIVYCFALMFDYGCQLQKQSDETL